MIKQNVTDELLKQAGYERFKKGPIDHDGIECLFQKRFDDEKGKKYFITVEKWAPMTHPGTGDTFGPGYEFDIQFDDAATECSARIKLFGGWTIEAAEKRAEELWQTGLWKYYERWDEC